MNRTRLALVLVALATTAATAPAQYAGYPQYNPQELVPGAFPAYGVPMTPYAPRGPLLAPPQEANAFSSRALAEPFNDPPYVPCVWASASYLSWTVQRAPNPVPIVTVGSTANAVPGAIGQPATGILYGAKSIDLGTQSGVQAGFGGWLNHDRCFGVEASVFSLEPKSEKSIVGSNAAGVPGLFLPFANRNTLAEGALAISSPALGQGAITVENKFNFEGIEANGLFNLCRTECWETNLLLGGRYLSLREGTAISAATVAGANTTTRFDQFDTHNDFFGGQIGTRFGYRHECFNLEATAKVAVGPTYQAVDVGGITNVTRTANGGLVSSQLGGVFARPGNIRHENRQDVSVVPQVQVKASVNIGSNATLFAAYDFLYLNEVVRPGDQIDHFLVPSPLPIFNRTDFWAQGVSFGLEVKF